jgi:CO/xanthine dehydrogenase FAD-binding subunit
MASVNIRNEATIAGNIENASPAGDSLPVLYCLDAVVVLQSVEGTREILMTDYITGLRKTCRKSHELITEIKIPDATFTNKRWVKVGGRQADAISKLSFVGLANIKDDVVLDLRLSFGAVSPIVIRERTIEKEFINIKLTTLKARTQELQELYDEFITPVDNQRSTKIYRRQVSLNILKDFIEHL